MNDQRSCVGFYPRDDNWESTQCDHESDGGRCAFFFDHWCEYRSIDEYKQEKPKEGDEI